VLLPWLWTAERARGKEHRVSEHYPETAALLLRQVPEILQRWDERVRQEIPASRSQGRLVLQNNLGQLLGEVTQALFPTGAPVATIEGLTLSQDHGRHRAELAEYSIDEMFLEYRLLRQTILDVLDEKRSLAPEEREVITNALERAMQDAVGRFALVHQEAERARADAATRMAQELEAAAAKLGAAYERERRIAQVLQRPLRLQVAEDAVPGLDLATLYQPAWEEADVGGDFLDVFILPDGQVALVVGDASGKGIEAAAHNTHVKDLLRAFLREEPRHLGLAFSRLNRALCDTLQEVAPDDLETFIVLALLVLDPLTGAGGYVSAGAEPLLLLRAGGNAQAVVRPALPLGIEPEAVYEPTTVHLAVGDTALLITDGITEARQGGQQLGYEGMVEIAQVALTAPRLQEAAQTILAGARGFAEGRLSDDACLILARRR
jgi:serine phosphatase RsbU (regulator of sigma subunit)